MVLSTSLNSREQPLRLVTFLVYWLWMTPAKSSLHNHSLASCQHLDLPKSWVPSQLSDSHISQIFCRTFFRGSITRSSCRVLSRSLWRCFVIQSFRIVSGTLKLPRFTHVCHKSLMPCFPRLWKELTAEN